MRTSYDNFRAISKIMIGYMHYFFKIYGHQSANQLLLFNKENIELFEENVRRQANKINNKMKNGCCPDRHKIIAACLKSFVASDIFRFNDEEYNKLLHSGTCEDETIHLCVIYPNEMYCIFIIKIILNEYSRFKNIDDYNLVYPDHIVNLDGQYHNYVIDLFKLIMGYHKKNLDMVVQELAHILFFIEMGYEISMKGLIPNYYKVGLPQD